MKPGDPSSLSGIVTACFVGTWAILGLTTIYLLYLETDVAFKRRWYPRLVLLAGVLFAFFAVTMTALDSGAAGALTVACLIVPMSILISILNIRLTRFCGQCDAVLLGRNPFSSDRFCSKCGASFEAKEKGTRGPLE